MQGPILKKLGDQRQAALTFPIPDKNLPFLFKLFQHIFNLLVMDKILLVVSGSVDLMNFPVMSFKVFPEIMFSVVIGNIPRDYGKISRKAGYFSAFESLVGL